MRLDIAMQLKSAIDEQIHTSSPKYRKIKLWPRMAVAASIALAIIIGGYLYLNHKPSKQDTIAYANDVTPGKNAATLILASGKKIVLSDAKNGQLAEEAGVLITKDANGQLSYEIKDQNLTETNRINTLTTAKGETYQVKLPDGTTIWLNAASTLKYPASFARLRHRSVELIGEAYFEVAKDKLHPFVVNSKDQQVEVLGTHFNINSYANEPAIKTTLLEGSVKVSLPKGKHRILEPNQQASFAGAEITVADIDPELAMAWKDNNFIFDNADIGFIMRMVERWYNVRIIYDGPIPEDKFNGAVSRFKNVSYVLRIMERTGKVHFKIDGRNILVSK